MSDILLQARQGRDAASLKPSSTLPLIGFGLVAADLLAVFCFLGNRLYPLSPIWIYILFYTIGFAFYVYAAGRLIPAIPSSLSYITVPIILIGAVLFRLAVVFAPPKLSTDIFLYVWDGRLTLHGINPYHWAPNALPLRFLRDSIWNHAEYRSYQSNYMPVSQMIFAGANALFGNDLIGYKFIYMLFDVGVIGLLLVILQRLGRPLTQVIWYAWCPLPITEISMAGHQDVVGVFFLMLAFALVLRSRRWVGAAALALVAAALTKGFALLLLPLFIRAAGKRFALWAFFGLAYLGMPMWVYLPQFLHGMNQYLMNVHANSGLFAWVNFALHPAMGKASYKLTEKLSDAAILAVTCWASWRPIPSLVDLLRRAFLVLAVTLLVIPTLFPWYLIWALAFVPLLGRRPLWSVVLLSGLSVLLYTFYFAMMPYPWVPVAEYLPVFLLLAWEYRLWRLSHRPSPNLEMPAAPHENIPRCES